MGARSIYEKICPACAGVVARAAERCPCGYGFGSEDADATQQSLDDEQLYETYLAARLDQGLEALELARAALRARPGDYGCAMRVMQHVHELQVLRRELEGQRAKLAVAPEAPARVGHRASPVPTDAFRAAQSERAEVVARRTAPGICSACGCPSAANGTRCTCGGPARSTPDIAADIARADSDSIDKP
ncbi:hypothetical protein SVA_2273 [Sulfurifustis variabilis]|uniref:Uncharacterized protein n=1 Tax=Sulfurifustis variabilis TaxID=1675686 RepID=A0A1B4V5K5_9GAMM|nr:hypothetical protein [Sulfurifustis variabilis]BAU48823.1 hypothetical protein SVA_2273 [Sulfurifustis variabilis]